MKYTADEVTAGAPAGRPTPGRGAASGEAATTPAAETIVSPANIAPRPLRLITSRSIQGEAQNDARDGLGHDREVRCRPELR